MAESIVKVPRIKEMDYDFIAFSFKGLHSFEDFGIYRTSDGNTGYNDNLAPQMKEQTMEVPGQAGQYYLGTQHKSREFNIKFAFDNMSENTLNNMKVWLSGEDLGDLWFAEAPHKVYTAKVNGAPQINALAFSENGKRVYKGTGSVKFICYYPYAHTPTWIQHGEAKLDGKIAENYAQFNNYEEIRFTLPGMVDFVGTHTLVEEPAMPEYGLNLNFECDGKIYNAISPSGYGPDGWGITGLAYMGDSNYDTVYYHIGENDGTAGTPVLPAFSGWQNYNKRIITIKENPTTTHEIEWLSANLEDGVSSTPYGQLPFTFKANLKRVGYHRITLHANNGTNVTKTIERQFDSTGKLTLSISQEEFSSQTNGAYIVGWASVQAATIPASGWEYSGTTGGRFNIDFFDDEDLYAIWSNQYTISFYNSLSYYAKTTYIGGFLNDSYLNHTGPQQLYGCRISYDGEHYENLYDWYYKGKFTANGLINTMKVPYGTKIQVWVQDDPKYQGTSCHILENGATKKSEGDPSYIFTVTNNTQIVFDWRLSGISYFGSSNWNCYINTGSQAKKITNGIYQGAT